MQPEAQQAYPDPVRLGPRTVVRSILPYIGSKITEQFKGVWFLIAYLMVFQWLVLNLPLVYGGMITIGVVGVLMGLTLFMEGLRLGLMPLGELVGTVLPKKLRLRSTLVFACILGLLATIAEPAIFVLRQAGAGVDPAGAPLLWSLLNPYANQLVLAVGAGVGIAVALGVLRFYRGDSLKPYICCAVLLLLGLTALAQWGGALGARPALSELMRPLIGLAWDCGAVTTGPVTVPLVLALGVGVCRKLSSGNGEGGGFGIVTLASLFPIMGVLLLGMYHYWAGDYVNHLPQQVAAPVVAVSTPVAGENAAGNAGKAPAHIAFTQAEVQQLLTSGTVERPYEIRWEAQEVEILPDGSAKLVAPHVVLQPTQQLQPQPIHEGTWRPGFELGPVLKEAFAGAAKAIALLCGMLLAVLIIILRQRPRYWDEIALGLSLGVLGLGIFLAGIALGLGPLGAQVGQNLPAAFASITPWQMEGAYGPLFGVGSVSAWGKWVAIGFAFVLGYGATLAEPALSALGATVEKMTVGAFKSTMLKQAVAVGVGFGLALGVTKIAYGLELTWLLIPPYLLLLVMTLISTESYVHFAWDSAGVTTGPITVPLVLAMGLGIGAQVGASDGFGMLALASIGPIMSVLIVGLFVRSQALRAQAAQAAAEKN